MSAGTNTIYEQLRYYATPGSWRMTSWSDGTPDYAEKHTNAWFEVVRSDDPDPHGEEAAKAALSELGEYHVELVPDFFFACLRITRKGEGDDEAACRALTAAGLKRASKTDIRWWTK